MVLIQESVPLHLFKFTVPRGCCFEQLDDLSASTEYLVLTLGSPEDIFLLTVPIELLQPRSVHSVVTLI